MSEKGILYMVATPIGNLEDITLRAIRVLNEVDLIAAEDTRQTIKLLNHFKIKKAMISYHEHNKMEKGGYIIRQLLDGKNVAMVSDAGSPGISDPGEDIVKLAIGNGIGVTMVPGAVAAIMGLVLSGFSTGRFVFEGFLPMNKRARRERIIALEKEVRTVIFYEAPHKLMHTLQDLYEILGDREIVLARELTKKFEEIMRCTLTTAIKKYTDGSPKGEFVLLLKGKDEEKMLDEEKKEWENMSIHEHLEIYLKQGFQRREATKKVAGDRGVSKRDIYNSLLEEE